MVGESSRVSIREHAIIWVGRSAATCAVVIVGTCFLPLVFGHHFFVCFFIFCAICHRLLLHPCFSSFLLFHVSSLSFHVNSYLFFAWWRQQ